LFEYEAARSDMSARHAAQSVNERRYRRDEER